MERATRERLEDELVRLRSALDDSSLFLDHYAAGGGYRVMRGQGEIPFVHERMPAGQMLQTLRFANRVLDLEDRLNREGDDQAYRRGVEDCAEKWPYYEELLS